MPKDEFEQYQKQFPHHFKRAKIHESAWIAHGAVVMGDTHVGKESSIWFNSVVRGDVHSIRIGERTNIQDLTMVHVAHESSDCVIGNDVTIGHSAILHACHIGDHCLIGMGSQILDKAEIGDWVLLGAGSLVTPGTKIPSGSKAMGRPARVVGKINEKERAWLEWNAQHYVRLAKAHQIHSFSG